MKKLQEKLANSVRQVKTQQEKKPTKSKATVKKTKTTTAQKPSSPLPSRRTWPD